MIAVFSNPGAANLRRAAFAARVAGFWALIFGLGWWLLHFLALPGDNDFHNYAVAALVGLRHGWSELYNLELQRAGWTSYTAGAGSLPFIYRAFASPPPVAWIALPFALLALPAGYALWSLVVLAALFLTWAALAPGPGPVRFLQLGFAICLAPVAWELRLGGDVAFVMVGVAGGWWLLRSQRDLLAGVVLAAICLKPNLAFLVPIALLALRRWRAFAAFAVCAAAIAAASAASLGSGGLGAYAALLQREDSLHFNWYLSLAQLTGTGAPQLVASAVVAGAGVVVIFRRRRDPEGALAAALFASVAASPYLHAQDFSVLLPAAWLTWRALPSPWRWSVLALAPAAEVVFSVGSLPLLLVSLALLCLLAGPGEHLSRVDQPLLARAREVNADARAAGAP